MTQANRPLSPHMQVYKWRVHMMTSIMHRATGVALAVGTGLLIWWLASIAIGVEAYDAFMDCANHWFGRLVLFGITLAAMQHMASGVRHLFMDAGALYDLPINRATAIATYIFAVVATLVIWAFGYGLVGGAS